MTERGKLILGALRRNFELLAELDRAAPADVDQITSAIVAHLRSWKPMALMTFDTAPIPKIDP